MRIASHCLQVKTEVKEFVASLLKPKFAQRSIDKEQYKWVAKKSVENVLKSSTLEPGKPFMDSKRKNAIAVLVDKYIKGYRKP